MKQIPLTLDGNGADLYLGNGNFDITVSGIGDIISAGAGNDTVKLGASKLALVTLGPGNSTVTGTGGNNDIILHSAKGNTDTVNVGTARQDAVIAGSGDTRITANGYGEYVAVGDGNNTIIANGDGDAIVAGSGRNIISANGSHDLINLAVSGGKSDFLIAGGDHDTISLGKTIAIADATGSHDNIFVNGTLLGSQIIVGSQSRVFITANQTEVGFGPDPGDNFTKTVQTPSSVRLDFIGIGDTVFVQGPTSGKIVLDGLSGNIADLVQMPTLSTYAEVQHALVHAAGGWKLPTPGGGEVLFEGAKPTAANFAFT